METGDGGGVKGAYETMQLEEHKHSIALRKEICNLTVGIGRDVEILA